MVSTLCKPKLALSLLTSLTMNTLEERLRLALKQAQESRPTERINQAWLSRQVGISSAAIAKWFNSGTQSLEGENLIKASRALGVAPAWLASGSGQMNDAGQAEPEFPRTPREEDFYLIPIYSSYGACGNGFLNDHVEVIGDKAFGKEQIKKLNIDPYAACIIHAAGDSMYPYIADGDEVLIDKRIAPTRTGEIYAVMMDGEVFIKRLAKEFGSLVLRSDNVNKSMYPDMHVPPGHDLTIIGRVVWRGGGV